MNTTIEKIPQPKTLPIIGNLNLVNIEMPVQSLMAQADQFGEIFKMQMVDEEIIVISSQELVNEVCDVKRFDKILLRPVEELRAVAGDGLFTANTNEPNWEKAHRILMPAFGPGAIREMYPKMLDVAEQMMLKIERQGPNHLIDVSDVMTRLTLDTIALCAFNYRFNSFYKENMHPFVQAMVEALSEGNNKAFRLGIQDALMFLTRRKHLANTAYLNKVADEIIAERKRNSHSDNAAPKNDSGQKDLLDLMLHAKDPITGEGLSDENIRNQLITFLVAGHETTSGMLSFAIHLLLKNPEVLKKAQEEVDRIVGNEMPTVQHISQLTYIDQVLKEALRLYPTAPAFGIQPLEDTMLAGKYFVKKGATIIVLLSQLHREEKVWGTDAHQFQPERFEPSVYQQMPPNCWKPFGNGQRACIGRPFAMQEAILALTMLLLRFDISSANPDYQLNIKETLTLKPEQLYMKAKRRSKSIIKTQKEQTGFPALKGTKPLNDKPTIPLLVLYGSNSGSSKSFAETIVSSAPGKGFKPTIGILNDYVNQLPRDGAVLLVTASYEGQPTDNARQFVEWLDTCDMEDLKGVKYAVFGCGHKDWVRTYQAIPKKIDTQMADAGAVRLLERGEADARGDFFGDFDAWQDRFWKKLSEDFGQKNELASNGPLYEIEMVANMRNTVLRQTDLQTGVVIANRELVNMNHPLGRSKRHIEIEIPDGMTYRAGDYLVVLPSNPPVNVDRVLRKFNLSKDTQLVIHKQTATLTYLPTGFPITIGEILTNYVELAQPATKKQVQILAKSCVCPPHIIQLLAMSKGNRYQTEILDKRVSVLDLLERFAACDLPLTSFLEMLPPLKPRQYSISSSPMQQENRLTLTVAVVNGSAWSGQGQYQGVASNYLAYAQPGTKITLSTRPSNMAFRLPDELTTPIIMIGAGSGIAPFRGFLEERALQEKQGKEVGEGALFFGCDHPEVDFLYQKELSEWSRAGVVKVYPAFSESPQEEVQYVQHRIWKERQEIIRLFQNGARIYVCGDGKYMAPAVRATLIRIYQEATQTTAEEAEAWAAQIEREGVRYITDVFS